MQEGKKLIYCCFVGSEETFDDKKELCSLKEKLKLGEIAEDKIVIIKNNGIAEELINLIKEKI